MKSLRYYLVFVLVFLPLTAWSKDYLYVTNETRDLLSIIDGDMGLVVQEVPLGSGPCDVILDRTGDIMAVSHQGKGGELWLLNRKTLKVKHKVLLEEGKEKAECFYLAFSDDSRRLYAVNKFSGLLYVVDPVEGKIKKRIELGGEKPYLFTRPVLSPDGRRLYTVDGRHGRITVVDTVRGIVADTITADGAIAVVLSPDGKTLYVVNGENSSLDILDLETKKRGKQIPLGNGTIDADISPDGSLLFISNQHSYSVTVVDSKHQELAANIQVGTFPMGIKVSPDGKRAYVCNWIDGDVSIIDTAAKREISRVLVKSTPLAIAVYHSP